MSESEWEKRLKEVTKPAPVEWEKTLEEAAKPITPEYERTIKEAHVEVDELKRAREEFGLVQKPKVEVNPIIPAVEWKKLSTKEILDSIDIATRVLRERSLTSEEKKYACSLAKDFIEIGLDPEEEEEEYSAVREAALRARGVRLLP